MRRLSLALAQSRGRAAGHRLAGRYGARPGRAVILGPVYTDLDLTLVKTFPLAEAGSPQCQVAGRNALNHLHFNVTPTFQSPSSPDAGKLTCAHAGREVDFSFRFLF